MAPFALRAGSRLGFTVDVNTGDTCEQLVEADGRHINLNRSVHLHNRESYAETQVAQETQVIMLMMSRLHQH